MADDGKPTGPTEGAEECRRTKLLERSRDITGTSAGWSFIGGIAPEVIAKLKARGADQPEEPGDDHGA
jgi:hypothetical protein